MSESTIRLANDGRLASEQRTRSVGGSSVLVDYQEVAIANLGPQPLSLQKYFTNASSVEMAVDGSTPVNFDVAPADAEIYRIEKLVLVMVLSSSPTMLQFGNLAALANGLSIKVLDATDATIVDLLDGQDLKSNNDLATVGDVTLHELGLSYTLKTTLVPVSPVRLQFPTAGAEKLRITVADDLLSTPITRMRCLALGRQEHIVT